MPFVPESVCEGFFVKNICRTTYHLHLHIFTSAHPHSHLYLCSCSHLHIYISAHLHICTPTSPLIFTSLLIFLHLRSSSHLHICISADLHILTSTSLLIFIFTHLHLCSCSYLHIDISAHLHILTSTSHVFTSRSSLLSLLRPGAVPPEHHETQPSTEIMHVEGAKCRRECDLVLSGATLCADRARRRREMQDPLRGSCVSRARNVRFGPVAGNPLRRSCASRARNAGESAFWPGPVQPSVEIVRVEGAKCRRECVFWPGPAQPSAVSTL